MLIPVLVTVFGLLEAAVGQVGPRAPLRCCTAVEALRENTQIGFPITRLLFGMLVNLLISRLFPQWNASSYKLFPDSSCGIQSRLSTTPGSCDPFLTL